MTTLYLDRKNLEIKIDSGTLAIYKSGTRQSTVPIKLLERVVVRGEVTLSTATLAGLASQGVGFTVISGRKGEKVANLTGPLHNDVTRRISQYRCYTDIEKRAALASEIVAAKLENQHRLLHKLLKARQDQRYRLSKAIKTIAGIAQKSTNERNLDRLRGYEGSAAAAFFDAYAQILPPRLQFSGRNRRPPKDPVNACLSLSYTMAHADALRACHIAGLDPLLGMLHEPAYGRASLAADLIEPLRPHIDEWVWQIFRDRTLDVAHFSTEGEGCFLDKSGRQIYFREWEERAKVMRRWLRQHAFRFVKTLKSGTD